jgi:hypothetical protein
MDQTSSQSLGDQPSETTVDAFTKMFVTPFQMLGVPAIPAIESFSKVGHEVMDLATRRTQAIIEMPAKAIQCKTPQDLAAVTAEFWQTAWTHQFDCAKKIASLAYPTNGARLPDMLSESADAKDRPAKDWTDQRDRRAA